MADSLSLLVGSVLVVLREKVFEGLVGGLLAGGAGTGTSLLGSWFLIVRDEHPDNVRY
jgi:hypothetical protein